MDKVELLAPVGSMESLYAAVQNGANAVYLGGKVFNARQYASNFDYDELMEAVEYAHLRDVKVYITVNILVDNQEMEEVIEYIKFLYEINVDGIIVQDLGLAYLIHEFFRELEIHGSTQMTINNLPGAEFVREMGFSRIVLARETPLDEIKFIHNNSPIELEGFVHGALCVAYSGQCLMSSMIGGRSGNRGTCAQPCRRPYSIIDEKGVLVGDWDKKYILSTKDLNTIEYIEEIIDSGIISLKIEGRMKRPEYVATVVGNYRKALNEGSKSISQNDKKDIAQIFNREFTKGIMLGDFGKDFISSNRPDNRGILIGKVIRADRYKVYIELEEDIEPGDGIEFEIGKDKYKGMSVPFSGKKGSTIALEKPGYILKDTLVYKTSSLELLEKAKASYKEERIKKPIDMEIDIVLGENPKLILILEEEKVTIVGEEVVEKAQRAPLDKEKIIEQLSKLGDTNYTLNNIQINLEENTFLPLSALNFLRREGTKELDNITKGKNKKKPLDLKEYNQKRERFFQWTEKSKSNKRDISVKVSNIEQFNQLDLNKLDRIYLGFYDDISKAIDKLGNFNKEIYLWTDKILYQEDLRKLEKVIKTIEKDIHGISVSNLGTLKYVQDRFDLNIHGDIGLNLFNSYSIEYLKSKNLKSIALSPELNLKQINGINTDMETEAYVYGFLPVMVMKTCPMALAKGCIDDKDCKTCNFSKGYGLKDRIDAVFYTNRYEGFSTIYNSVPLMVLDSLKEIYNSGVTMGRLDFTIEQENIYEIQRHFYDFAKGIIDEKDVSKFMDDYRTNTNITNGHYFRGVM